LKISRLDLDGAGSPSALVERILAIEPDLPVPVPIEALCERFDIVSIGEIDTDQFEAALITDELRSTGHILVASGRSPQRRRVSIGHELGHFLIPTHKVPAGGGLYCSAEDLRLLETGEQDCRRRMEAEANSFAARLLMPPPLLKSQLRAIRDPQVNDIVHLASLFDVSREAMARAMTEHDRRSLAVIIVANGRVVRMYRNAELFPWIDAQWGSGVPTGSAWHERAWQPGEVSQVEECEPEVWLSTSSARRVEVLTEQVLGQVNGRAMILLHAELAGDD